MGMLTLLAALSTYMPALIFVNGKVSISHILTGYLGMLIMSGSVAAIGVFASSLTKSQVVAALLGAVIAFSFILGFRLSNLVEPPFTDIVRRFGLYDNNYMPFIEGRVPTRELVFFGSIIFGSLFLTTRMLEGRRFR
jgi:ABC-2 type transport system permease protein